MIRYSYFQPDTIWLFNIAMENPAFLIGKTICKWAIYTYLYHGYVK